MNSRMPPRYLPTLTEVVHPKGQGALVQAASQQPEPAASITQPQLVFGPLPTPELPDRYTLTQQVIKLVQPQMEAELRSIAMELFEAQLSTLLPSLQLQIEEAVREALDQVLPEQPHCKD